MSLNKVILIGNVGREPDVRYFDSGNAVANFTLATNERGYRLANGTEIPERTEWHNIVAGRDRALFVERHVHKGSLVYVEGKIRTRSYDDASGNKRYITEIYADRIEFFSLGGRRPQDAEHAGDASVATQPADAAAEVHAFAAKSEPTPTTSASDLEPISPADADPVDDLPF